MFLGLFLPPLHTVMVVKVAIESKPQSSHYPFAQSLISALSRRKSSEFTQLFAVVATNLLSSAGAMSTMSE